MPVTNDYVSICGTMPSPHTMAFRAYLEDYKAKRRLDCVFKRATTYFIDPDTGADTNAGTFASPWATLANVRAALNGTAGVGSNTWAARVTNTAFLLKRGTLIRDSTITNGGALVIRSAGIEIGAYGPMVASTTTREIKPIISNFTIQWKNGFTVTTPGGATDRRTFSLTASATVINPTNATRIGWLRVDRSAYITESVKSFISPYNAFTYCSDSVVDAGHDAAAYALVEATDYSFYCPSAGGTVSVNAGAIEDFGITNAISSGACFEATPPLASNSLNYDGIRVGEGADQCYIHDIIVEGYGCQCESFQNGSGIRFGGASEDVCYLENVESYYNGRHALSMECDDTVNHYGGVLYKRNCIVGYCSPTGGANEDVAFANYGKHEFYNENYTIRFGFLPANTTNTTLYPANTFTAAGGINRLASFYGHSGGVGGGRSPVNLYVLENVTILDERDSWPTATAASEGFGYSDSNLGETPFLAGTDNDPTTYRVFVIGFRSPRYKITDDNAANRSARVRTLFINCHFYYNIASSVQVYIWQGVSTALFLNTIFEIDVTNTVTLQNNLALALFQQNAARAINQRLLNCELHIRGGDSAGYFGICTNNFGQSGTWGIPLGNCLLVNADNVNAGYSTKALKICYGAGGFSLANCPTNSPTFLRNLATYGCVLADVTAGDGGRQTSGFGNASNLLNLETGNVEIPTLPYGAASIIGSSQASAIDAVDRPLGNTSVLRALGSSNPFGEALTTYGMIPAPQYDFKWRQRPSIPSIGAFDVVSSSGGSGGGNVLVGDLVGSV